jgi:hypothetical protein
VARLLSHAQDYHFAKRQSLVSRGFEVDVFG